MARRSTSRRRASKGEGVPWFGLTLFLMAVLVIIGGLAWMYLRAVEQHPPTDAELCPEAGPTEQTIVLVDATDAIAAITQTEIVSKITDLANDTKKWARFELRVLVPGSLRTTTVFSRCNPGDGHELDEYTGNPDLARKKWASQFSGPLQEAMKSTMSGEVADRSPIMAGLQQIAVDRLSSKQARSMPTNIVVVSDMLENSDAFSVYQSGPDFEAYRKSSASKRYSTDLAGAGVSIWFLERDTKVASVPLIEFWMQWILENRGTPLTATRLQGMD
jgi:hypothetical protein